MKHKVNSDGEKQIDFFSIVPPNDVESWGDWQVAQRYHFLCELVRCGDLDYTRSLPSKEVYETIAPKGSKPPLPRSVLRREYDLAKAMLRFLNTWQKRRADHVSEIEYLARILVRRGYPDLRAK